MTTVAEEVATEVLDAPAALAEFNPVQKGLAELRKELAGVQFDVTTTAGDKAARAARAKCVTIRTSAKKVYETWNAPMLEKQRAMRDLVATITAEVEKIELPIDAQIKAEEARKAEIKAAKEAAELARQQAIQTRINAIGQYPVQAAGKSAADIAVLLAAVAELPITTELYEHRAGEAMQLHAEVVAKLEQMHGAALAQEQEAARLAAERAELEEQQRRLQAEREAENAHQEAARAEQARKDAEAAAALKRQQDEAAAALRAQQDEIDRQRREFEEQQAAARRVEQEKAEAAAREQQEKEAAARAEAEQAERARQEEAARRERENFEKVGPGPTAIAHAVAEYFGVDVQVAIAWLNDFDAASVEQITE
ncbi:hypothetical protein [Achromobacter denitrificans]|uniref:DUF1351 domain-containing protein n=1 Tax=Achromobacter denitrificans TaxID=32002 RepID=A0ABZ3GFK3_ACHDE